MATVYRRHELEKDILEIFGLTGRSVRRIELCFEVNSPVTANVEFYPTEEQVDGLVKKIKTKYTFAQVREETILEKAK